MDVDNLLAGQRFDRELARALSECDVFLTVIGSRWHSTLQQRLTLNAPDYVRQEIAQALARDIPVIPVIIDRAPISNLALPDDLSSLLLHQKHDITHERFGRDVDDLIAAIKATSRSTASGQGAGRLSKLARIAALIVLLAGSVGVAALGYQYFTETQRNEASRQERAAAEERTKASLAAANAKAEAETKRKAEEDERQRLAARAEEDRQRTALETVRVCREIEGMTSLSLLATLEAQHKGRPAGVCIATRISELKAAQAAVLKEEQRKANCRALIDQCNGGMYPCVWMAMPTEFPNAPNLVPQIATGTCDKNCAAEEKRKLERAGVRVLTEIGTASSRDNFTPGCIGFRSDIKGSFEGANCMRDILGSRYTVVERACLMSGFSYNIVVH